ncbi:Kinetochore complex Sim4 subunit Fta1 [Phytophthora infestans]|uniref:Kinetochore complex Sim4 subunit Fta1 n=1 Tax=Phytophthora infestans TaxID=4787 RepID=A0A833TBF0_PHYIN|nr:Kinetochore complex Sim4 subunit Fta1 [Phytophthora infestans]KAF4135818.1 Kinetochore complex Sim4 subunit Fta1 [Phytophthora infestans]
MAICCVGNNEVVETLPENEMVENSRPEPLVSAVQQQKLREVYSSPMRPTQYTRTPEEVGKTKETPREAAARRERERVSMEQVLLDRRWVFHCASPLFHFHRDKLSEYAHDLVKTLRAAALRACGQQFGYSVSIRNTDALVAFQIREERDQKTIRESDKMKARPERSGGFVLYFPTDEEQRVPRRGRERQQVLLLRGDEELLRWVCSWLQRRFQCVVSTHVVHIQQLNLKRLARNWAVASLLAEEARRSSVVNNQEEVGRITTRESSRGPLQLKYRATNEEDVVRTYTMTVPWATLRRLFQQTKDGPEGNRPSNYAPELIELVERLYFDSLPFDLSTYEIERVEMEEVAVDLDGGVELYSMDLVHTVLFSLLELLAVQNVAAASRPETTL